MRILLITCVLIAVAGQSQSAGDPILKGLTFTDAGYMDAAVWTAKTRADYRILYGDDRSPLQYADLRIPDRPAPETGHPVLVFFHGGAWRAEWSKDYNEAFVEALANQGFATWDVEFRRMGHRGGGYPGTFEDVADAIDYLRIVAQEHPLDLTRVVVAGHSSGGHLALWAAARRHLDASSPLYRDNPLPLKGVISIAGVNDLALSLEIGDRTDVLKLAGVESLADGVDRMAEVDPGRMLPLGVPLLFYIGDGDSDWRLQMTAQFQEKVRVAGDTVSTTIVEGANHMDIVDGDSGFAANVAEAARELLASSAN